jgi:FMN phosphatase YigB (HAD superfamily)
MTETKWIDFDIAKVQALKEEYETAMAYALELMPRINWNSPKQIREHFKETFDIAIPDGKIATFAALLPTFDEDTEEYQAVLEALMYLKMKYLLQNYLTAIIRHEHHGRITLRSVNSQWVMPNKQPLPEAVELTACIIASHI